jgi:hypothetical protein
LSASPSRKKLLAIVGLTFVGATSILFAAVLPAEFHYDPTGLGKATGLLKLSRPAEVPVTVSAGSNAVAHSYPQTWRTDTIEIPLAAAPTPGYDLEYKVRMKSGETLVYSWTAVDAPADEFYYDFHSESDPAPKVSVASHKEGTANLANGSLTAPFDGIHGWYFENQSTKPVVVRLTLAGFYELRRAD